MNEAGSVLLSVRAEARQLVAPDYAVLDGHIEITAGSKAEAVQSVAVAVDRLTAELGALGGVPFDQESHRHASRGRRIPLALMRSATTTRRPGARCGPGR